MQSESIAYKKALLFAKRIVYLSRHLNSEHREFVLAKQILRSGTSIGANIAEADVVQAARFLLQRFI